MHHSALVSSHSCINGLIISCGVCCQEFGQWLAAQEDFDFVIDAANVAYFNQNFKDGKFSYQQVRFVTAVVRSAVSSMLHSRVYNCIFLFVNLD